MRIGVSAVEWIIILGYGIGDINDNNYLFGKEHGLWFFVASMIFFGIYTFFPYLMPDIALPHDVPIRSKWRYAFLGEIKN